MNRHTLWPTLGIACLVAMTVTTVAAFAQSTTPTFDVADVHASPRRPESQQRPSLGLLNGYYNARNATLVDLIATAYDISGEQVVGGPTWLEFDRFDIVAKLPAGRTDVKPLLKSLLADRFKLVAREAESDVPALALVVDVTSRLQGARPSDDAAGARIERRRPMRRTSTRSLAADHRHSKWRQSGSFHQTATSR